MRTARDTSKGNPPPGPFTRDDLVASLEVPLTPLAPRRARPRSSTPPCSFEAQPPGCRSRPTGGGATSGRARAVRSPRPPAVLLRPVPLDRGLLDADPARQGAVPQAGGPTLFARPHSPRRSCAHPLYRSRGARARPPGALLRPVLLDGLLGGGARPQAGEGGDVMARRLTGCEDDKERSECWRNGISVHSASAAFATPIPRADHPRVARTVGPPHCASSPGFVGVPRGGGAREQGEGVRAVWLIEAGYSLALGMREQYRPGFRGSVSDPIDCGCQSRRIRGPAVWGGAEVGRPAEQASKLEPSDP